MTPEIELELTQAALASCRCELLECLDIINMCDVAMGQMMDRGNAGRMVGVDWGLVNNALCAATAKLKQAEGWPPEEGGS